MVDPGPMSRKLVMAKAISHVKLCDDLLDYILPTKATIFVGLINKKLDGQPFLWILLID